MLIALCPASLDTLKVSVPPAVLLAAAFCVQPTLDLDDFVACYNPMNCYVRGLGRGKPVLMCTTLYWCFQRKLDKQLGSIDVLEGMSVVLGKGFRNAL
jgi:hypothetical protein